MEKNKGLDNKAISDFIAYSNRNFTRKRQAMTILENLNKLNDEGIKIKGSREHKEQKDENREQKNNKNTSEEVNEEDNLPQLSLIKADSSEDYLESNEKKNELEISMVGEEKVKKKEKNVSEITTLIDNCNKDIKTLDDIIKKYRNSTKDYIMQSKVDIKVDISMVFIDKKGFGEREDSEEELEKKANYFIDIKKELVFLKKKLENLLSIYNSETELTKLKKGELENLEKLNEKYKALKQKKHNKKK